MPFAPETAAGPNSGCLAAGIHMGMRFHPGVLRQPVVRIAVGRDVFDEEAIPNNVARQGCRTIPGDPHARSSALCRLQL